MPVETDFRFVVVDLSGDLLIVVKRQHRDAVTLREAVKIAEKLVTPPEEDNRTRSQDRRMRYLPA